MLGKFVISTDKKGEFRFKLVVGNGQTIVVSEGYTTKAACFNGVETVRRYATEAPVEDATLALV